MIGREEKFASILDEIDQHKKAIEQAKVNDFGVVEAMKTKWMRLSIELSNYMGYAEGTAAKSVHESIDMKRDA